MFPPVNPKVRFPELEKEILEFWRKERIFQRSIDERNKENSFTFYDGPPFATGLPHYGHILAGIIKDVIPRYQTMRGHRVERRFGWDCHGLPIENIKEKELGISGKKQIEEYGIAKFNEDCRSIVMRYAHDWRALVERTGRWVDMDNDYKTMDASYMESVWWVFKQLWDKELVYQGNKVVPYCYRCSTALSNFEAGSEYKDRQDPALTVKFKLKGEENTYVLAWTTTPWTLPSNLALAVDPDETYYKIQNRHPADTQNPNVTRISEPVYFIASENFWSRPPVGEPWFYEQFSRRDQQISYKDEQGNDVVVPAANVQAIKGSKLVGKSYEPLFPYFKDQPNAFQIIPGDFIDKQEGTGVVHMAPAYGEDDYNACKQAGIEMVNPVDAMGNFTQEVPDFVGQNVHEAKKNIIDALKGRDAIFEDKTLQHSYPHCWRCDTPLIYRAVPTWYVAVTKLKEQLLKNNAQTKWVPETMRDGRFGKWLEGARDWAVSRSRYWGAPLPIWQCQDCGKTEALGSMEELFMKVPERIAKLVLVRHGESTKQTLGINAAADTEALPLTEKGQEQAREFRDSFAGEPFDAVYCSPMLRTRQTVEGLGEVKIDDRLREISKGKWEGIRKDDPAYVEATQRFAAMDVDEKVSHVWGDTGESDTMLAERTAAFLQDALSDAAGKKIVVCSHSAPMRLMIKALRGLDWEEFYRKRDLLTIKPGKSVTIYVDMETGREFDLHKHVVDELSWKCGCTSEKGKVFFVRHGHSEKNVQRVASRSVEDILPLTANGEAQAYQAAEQLKDAKISRIISSRVFRARQTAEIIASTIGIEIEYDDRLLETDMGSLEGGSCDTEAYQKAMEASTADPSVAFPGGGESYNDMRKRMREVYDDIRKKYPDENVLIVSHGDTLYVLDQELKGHWPVDWSKEALEKNYPKYATAYDLPASDGIMRRVPEVLDCWFESGSMPYAQEHYPFEHRNKFEANFPANFIAEGQDQTRGWFYTLMVLSTALFDKPAFRNVIVNGIVLAEDGKKMSKKLKNYPDPAIVMEQYGADAMRWYLMASPAVSANDLRFSEKGVDEVVKSVLLPLWNAYSFFVTYANIDGWQPDGRETKPSNPLDQWILSELQVCITRMTEALDGYDLAAATKPVLDFIDGLTNWYIRRSRRRFWKSENDGDKAQAYATLYRVLTTLTKLTAPFIPFISEEIHKGLNAEGDSVHLMDWPKVDATLINNQLVRETKAVREIVSAALSLRAQHNLKIRQPLSLVKIAVGPELERALEKYEGLFREEINVKKVVYDNIVLLRNPSIIANAKILGKRLGKEMQTVIRMGKEGNYQKTNDGVIISDGNGNEWALSTGEYEVRYSSGGTNQIITDHGYVVSLETTLTPELEREGIARELVRTIQDLRKEADYGVSDRILIGLTGVNDQVEREWGAYIEKETLGTITRDILEWDKEAALPEYGDVGVKRV